MRRQAARLTFRIYDESCRLALINNINIWQKHQNDEIFEDKRPDFTGWVSFEGKYNPAPTVFPNL